MTTPETPGANDDDVGTLAPRCPACGWQAHGLPDTLANSIVQRNAVMSHRDECPGSEPCVCGTPFTCLASTHEVDDTPVSSDKQTPGANERATHLCGLCGDPVRKVDLYGTPFFTHKPRRDCLTWWHIDKRRNNHQATPGAPITTDETSRP